MCNFVGRKHLAYSNATQSLVQKPAATAASGILLKIQIYRHDLRLIKSEPLNVEPRNLCIKEPGRR